MEAQLLHQVRLLKAGLLVLASAVAFLAFGGRGPGGESPAAPEKAVFDEIEVRRITVVDPHGARRVVLAHDAPPSIYRGKSLPRQGSPGMATAIFYDERGDEIGGIAFGKGPDGRGGEMISFDYSRLPLDGIKMGLDETTEGGGAYLILRDAPPADLDVDLPEYLAEIERKQPGEQTKKFAAHARTRIRLSTEGNDAEVVLTDTRGKKRIIIGVDREDRASIRILDADGKVVARIPDGR
jgi:hypothetical protein